MNKPLISIIIPNYNRENLIGETLDSILAQTYTNWECIIVDDGSTDNSKEIIQSYVEKDSRFQLHNRPYDRPKGANTCRNYGFELSKGEYINWFDSDDVMLPTFLEVKINLVEDHIDLLICTGYITDGDLNKREIINLKVETNLFKDYVTWKIDILTPSILFRRNFLIEKELFSNNITRGQETELFSRLFFKINKNKYLIINQPLFLYRKHEDTKTYKNKTYVKSYHESLCYIAKENLKRSIEIDDNELIEIFAHSLIIYLEKGLKNNHLKNSINALFLLIGILWKSKPKLLFKLLTLNLIIFPIKRNILKLFKHA